MEVIKSKYFREYIHLYIDDLYDFETKETLIGKWYEERSKIIFNYSLERIYTLIKVPKDCIDYLIIHEIIHFKYKNYDNSFFRMLNTFMPARREEKILDEVVMREL